MVAKITIVSDKGITHALKTAANNSGYNTSCITKQNWQDTINKLEEIQNARIANGQSKIYETTDEDGWHGKMVVNEGDIEFSDTEIESLYVSMGLDISNKKNKATEFNEWTNKIANNPTGQNGDFQVKSETTKTNNEYNADLAQIAEDYINIYDEDNDGQVSFAEYKKVELKDVEEEVKNNPEYQQVLDASLETLKLSYDRINVNNDASSEGWDKNELMNFFFTTDSLNETGAANGTITQQEMIWMNSALMDSENGDGEVIAKRLSDNYNNFFKNN